MFINKQFFHPLVRITLLELCAGSCKRSAQIKTQALPKKNLRGVVCQIFNYAMGNFLFQNLFLLEYFLKFFSSSSAFASPLALHCLILLHLLKTYQYLHYHSFIFIVSTLSVTFLRDLFLAIFLPL